MTLPNASFRSLCLAGGLAALVLPASMQATILGPEEFARLDTNKDGVVSAAENAAGARAIFRQVDANRDDVVTVTEVAIAEERRAESRGRPASSAPKSVSAGLRQAAEQMKIIDENGDGEVTSAEMVAGAQQRFALMDVNQDGYLDPAECEAGLAS